VVPLDNVGNVIVSEPYAPLGVTSVYATPSLESADCHAAVVAPPMSSTFRLSVGGVAAEATLAPSGAMSAPLIAMTAIAIGSSASLP